MASRLRGLTTQSFVKNDMRFLKTTKSSGVGKVQRVSSPICNTCARAGNIIQMMQLRKKILILRESIDLPPHDDSGPILELILGTVNDFQKLYPDVVPKFLVNDKDNMSIKQALVYLYHALRAMGNVWVKNQKHIPDLVADTNDDIFEEMKPEELGEQLLAKLDEMTNMARKILDAMDEDEKNKENRIQGWASGDTLNESCLDRTNKCPSPVTTISCLPEQKLLMEFGELAEASHSHQLLMPYRLQSLGQLSHTVVHQLLPSKSPPAYPLSISPMEQEMGVDECIPKSSAASNNMSKIRKNADNVEEVPLCDSPSRQTAKRNKAENSITKPEPAVSLKAVTHPTPPALLQSSNRSSPPSPLPISQANGSLLLPSPPMMQTSKSAPPPPPALGVSKALRPKKTNTKLKKSPQMGNLYRLLKGKVEGSSLNNKQGGRKSKIGGAADSKLGMADALAEMARRSAYFQQIEADVTNHAKSIMEVKTALVSFQTKNMTDLTNFHRYVEQHLEKLSDETQVLARFEGFPSRKLETLRMAAAMFAKLEGMAKTLENWKMERPLEQLLQRVETYFTKIKREIDSLERTKDEDCKRFQSHNISFEFDILVRIKESMVNVSSNCMELALREAKETASSHESTSNTKPAACQKLLWRTFQLAYQVYSFAGGQDDRAEQLTRELAKEIETLPEERLV